MAPDRSSPTEGGGTVEVTLDTNDPEEVGIMLDLLDHMIAKARS